MRGWFRYRKRILAVGLVLVMLSGNSMTSLALGDAGDAATVSGEETQEEIGQAEKMDETVPGESVEEAAPPIQEAGTDSENSETPEGGGTGETISGNTIPENQDLEGDGATNESASENKASDDTVSGNDIDGKEFVRLAPEELPKGFVPVDEAFLAAHPELEIDEGVPTLEYIVYAYEEKIGEGAETRWGFCVYGAWNEASGFYACDTKGELLWTEAGPLLLDPVSLALVTGEPEKKIAARAMSRAEVVYQPRVDVVVTGAGKTDDVEESYEVRLEQDADNQEGAQLRGYYSTFYVDVIEYKIFVGYDSDSQTWKGTEEDNPIFENAGRYVQVPNITFTKAGTYRFTIRQVPGWNNNTSFDETSWILEVTVEKQNGVFVVTKAEYTRNGESTASDAAMFANEFALSGNPVPTDYQPRVHFVVTGSNKVYNTISTDLSACLKANADNQEGAALLYSNSNQRIDQLEYRINKVEYDSESRTWRGTDEYYYQMNRIRFTKAGSYRFTISHNDPEYADSNFLVDKKPWTLEVTVENQDGKLAVTKTEYTRDGDSPDRDAATFTDVIKRPDTAVAYQPKAKIFVDGAKAGGRVGRDKEFLLRITEGYNGPVLDKKTATVPAGEIDADGYEAVFDEISFTHAGNYLLYIYLEGSDGQGYTYEKHIYYNSGKRVVDPVVECILEVTVKAKADGALAVTDTRYETYFSSSFPDERNSDGAFQVFYDPDDTTYSPEVINVISGNTAMLDDFTFQLKENADNQEGATLPKSTTLSMKNCTQSEVSGRFSAITFTRAGTYNFTVSEEKGDASYIAYDTTPWNLKVTVEDQGGRLVVVKTEYTRDAESRSDAAEFRNDILLPEDETGDLTIKLEGEGVDKNRTYNFAIKIRSQVYSTSRHLSREQLGVLSFNWPDIYGGTAYFSLKPGESITAEDLPVSYKYEIYILGGSSYDRWGPENNTEKKPVLKVGDIFNGYQVQSFENLSGTIVPGENVPAILTLTEGEKGPTGNLTFTYELADASKYKNRSLDFSIRLNDLYSSNGKGEGQYGDVSFSTSYRDGIADFSLRPGESVTAEDLPAGLTYTIMVSDISGSLETGQKIGNRYQVQSFEKMTGIIPEDGTAVAVLTLEEQKGEIGNLTFTCGLDGGGTDENTTYTFKLVVRDSETRLQGNYGDIHFNRYNAAFFSLELGESITVEDLPAGVPYEICLLSKYRNENSYDYWLTPDPSSYEEGEAWKEGAEAGYYQVKSFENLSGTISNEDMLNATVIFEKRPAGKVTFRWESDCTESKDDTEFTVSIQPIYSDSLLKSTEGRLGPGGSISADWPIGEKYKVAISDEIGGTWGAELEKLADGTMIGDKHYLVSAEHMKGTVTDSDTVTVLLTTNHLGRSALNPEERDEVVSSREEWVWEYGVDSSSSLMGDHYKSTHSYTTDGEGSAYNYGSIDVFCHLYIMKEVNGKDTGQAFPIHVKLEGCEYAGAGCSDGVACVETSPGTFECDMTLKNGERAMIDVISHRQSWSNGDFDCSIGDEDFWESDSYQQPTVTITEGDATAYALNYRTEHLSNGERVYEVSEYGNQENYTIQAVIPTELASTGGLIPQYGITLINTPKETEEESTGSLTVSKKIEGTAADANDEFSFAVALSDTTVNGSRGKMEFTDGTATFTLKGGESITASGLPAGISYTVTETDSKGYTSSAMGDKGTISANTMATADFTNHKDKSEPEQPKEPENPPTPPEPSDPPAPPEPSDPPAPPVPTAVTTTVTPETITVPEQGVLGAQREVTAPAQGVLGETRGVQTGDSSNLTLWVILMAAAASVIVERVLSVRKKKSQI